MAFIVTPSNPIAQYHESIAAPFGFTPFGPVVGRADSVPDWGFQGPLPIRHLHVRGGEIIDGIEVPGLTKGGGDGGHFHDVELRRDEFITGVEVCLGVFEPLLRHGLEPVVRGLKFMVHSLGGERRELCFGSFGGGHERLLFDARGPGDHGVWALTGIHGKGATYVDAIGFTWHPIGMLSWD